MHRRRNYLLPTICAPRFADDNAGDDGAGDDTGGGDAGGTSYTAPASQADLDRIVEQRLARERKQYGMTPAEAKAFKERAENLANDLSSETDQAKKKAADEARAESEAKLAPRLVRQAFKAEAKGVLSSDQLDVLLEDLDLTKYLDSDGDVDEEKVTKKVTAFAPKKGDDSKDDQRRKGLGQGQQRPAGAKPGDAGRAEAQKRFAKQT